MSRNLVGPGAAGIASLIARAGSTCSGHRDPEFGTIMEGGMLLADSYSSRGIQIPPHTESPGGYRVLRGFRANVLTTSSTTVADHGGHTHTAPDIDQESPVDLIEGDRVLILWIGPQPVIVGRI